MGLWVTWSSWRCPWATSRWKWIIFEVPSNPTHSRNYWRAEAPSLQRTSPEELDPWAYHAVALWRRTRSPESSWVSQTDSWGDPRSESWSQQLRWRDPCSHQLPGSCRKWSPSRTTIKQLSNEQQKKYLSVSITKTPTYPKEQCPPLTTPTPCSSHPPLWGRVRHLPASPHPQLQAIKWAVNCAWVWRGCRGASSRSAVFIACLSRLLMGMNSPKPRLCTSHTPQACNRRQELGCSLSWEPAALE